MALNPSDLPPAARTFLEEYHLASLTTLRPDGSPHVVPVGFSYDEESRTVRIITRSGSVKTRNARRGGRGVVCQVDGGRWLSLEGTLRVRDDPEGVMAAVRGYAARYRPPGDRADRVAIELDVDRVLGNF
jgi:F420H(2)-dependent biliverdin reductase